MTFNNIFNTLINRCNHVVHSCTGSSGGLPYTTKVQYNSAAKTNDDLAH